MIYGILSEIHYCIESIEQTFLLPPIRKQCLWKIRFQNVF